MKLNVTFDSLGLSKSSLLSIKKKGFKDPSEIQARIIPLVLENKHDIIGVSQTGSGKTASFALPILEMIRPGNKTPKVIILAPTRELALQVTSEIQSFSSKENYRMLTVYGGSSINNQIKTLRRGVDIVVGTPGRVLDLIKRQELKLSNISYFVLDEADEMLKMGFIDDIETIFEKTPESRRVLLFSATMPPKIRNLSKKYMKDQVIVDIKSEIKINIKQKFATVQREQKFQAICSILNSSEFFYGIVFCMTKKDVNELTSKLRDKDFDADCIHGDIIQSKREKILNKFRDLKLNILVATDVAARGIDVSDLTHVINHSLPKEVETYIHRIGRTGRAGKSGIAISLVTPKQKFMIKEIEDVSNVKFEKISIPNLKDEIKSRKIIFKNKDEKPKKDFKKKFDRKSSEDSSHKKSKYPPKKKFKQNFKKNY